MVKVRDRWYPNKVQNPRKDGYSDSEQHSKLHFGTKRTPWFIIGCNLYVSDIMKDLPGSWKMVRRETVDCFC